MALFQGKSFRFAGVMTSTVSRLARSFAFPDADGVRQGRGCGGRQQVVAHLRFRSLSPETSPSRPSLRRP